MTTASAISLGGLTVAVLDGLDAVVFFGLRGVSPVRIFQSIAAGLLGRASYQGGYRSAALGLAVHLTVATTIVAVAYLIARRAPALVRRPVPAAAVYGLAVWCTMNFVVIPLSAIGSRGAMPLPVVANGLLIHFFGVGLPAVLFARAASAKR